MKSQMWYVLLIAISLGQVTFAYSSHRNIRKNSVKICGTSNEHHASGQQWTEKVLVGRTGLPTEKSFCFADINHSSWAVA